jgi:ATP-dependent DNA ligase
VTAQFMFPMKPVPVFTKTLERLDLPNYRLESKLDGHRAILTVDGGRASLWTRLKVQIAVTPSLQAQLSALRLRDGTVLDGEIWNPLKRGGWTLDGREPTVVSFWDCVRDGPEDLSESPLEERYSRLASLVGKRSPEVRVVRQEDATRERIAEVEADARASRDRNLSRSGYVHGVVLKRRGSPRRDRATRSAEHPDWLKLVFF